MRQGQGAIPGMVPPYPQDCWHGARTAPLPQPPPMWGVQLHICPAEFILPSPNHCQHVQRKRKWGVPHFFGSTGENIELGQLKHFHPLLQDLRGLHCLRVALLHPHALPLHFPLPHPLCPLKPLGVPPHPRPGARHFCVRFVQAKSESPDWTLRGLEEGGIKGEGVGARQGPRQAGKIEDRPSRL